MSRIFGRRERGEGAASVLLVLIGLILLAIGGITTCSNNISYSKGLGGHIRNAQVSNSLELATQEMERIVSYAKDHGYTSGYTSVLYNTPEEDIGFWFRNMEQSLAELKKLSTTDSTQLERSNTLLKLHETLGHVPEGMANFPDNKMVAWILIIGLALFLLGLFACGALNK